MMSKFGRLFSSKHIGFKRLYLVVIFFLPTLSSAAVVSINFSGINLNVIGEYINALPVPAADHEFAPMFQTGQTVTGSITYDTDQADQDPDPNTGTYRVGSLAVEIPEIGLMASVSSDFMQISAFNDVGNANDQFFAFENSIDSFTNDVGLPHPDSFSVLLFGNTSMLSDDTLPTENIDWTFGNLSFDFTSIEDGSKRQVLMTFSPAPVPLPAAVWLFGSALFMLIGIARQRLS
ncbi:MAG: hypothetical protein AB2705_13745 [Candidatus Thiodiazotropha sp.]